MLLADEHHELEIIRGGPAGVIEREGMKILMDINTNSLKPDILKMSLPSDFLHSTAGALGAGPPSQTFCLNGMDMLVPLLNLGYH